MKFYIISGIFLLLGSLTVAVPSCNSTPCIGVDIYYEALCGKCAYFLEHQLAPAHPALKDHLDINFIPYGKASHLCNKKKECLVTCQRGILECRSNKAHACALKVIEDTSSPEKKQEHSVNLVKCAMSGRIRENSVSICAEKIGLKAPALKKIAKCMDSTEGNALLAAHGEKTHDFQSPLRAVPTIVINEIYSEKYQKEAYHSFERLICSLLKQRGKHLPSCAKFNKTH